MQGVRGVNELTMVWVALRVMIDRWVGAKT